MLDIERIIRSYNIEIRYLPIVGIRAAVKKMPDGYVIAIEESLASHEQMLALEHELWHIVLGHLDDREDISLARKEYEVATGWNWKCDCESID